MSVQRLQVTPDIFKEPSPNISITTCSEASLTDSILRDFLLTIKHNAVGVAPIYGTQCVLSTITFASETHVLSIKLPGVKSKNQTGRRSTSNVGRILLISNIFCNTDVCKYAFRMDKIAAGIHLDHGVRVTNAVDLLSNTNAGRHSVAAVMQTLGGETVVQKANVIKMLDDEERKTTPLALTALQAWAAFRAGRRLVKSNMAVKLIDTKCMDSDILGIAAKTLRDAERLEVLKPTRVRNDISKEFTVNKGKLQLTSTRYKTRVMESSTQTIEIQTRSCAGSKNVPVKGRATRVDGRAATISLHGSLKGDRIKSITTVGREEPNSAEAQRADIVMNVFCQTVDIPPFVRHIWLDTDPLSTSRRHSRPARAVNSVHFPRPLNPSQVEAIQMALSNEDQVSLIHGPPGTGKTTVIAAVVTNIITASSKRTVWLMAQSNVAVKNIAEKLADTGFLKFKLIVSHDFHYDWHEHLYESIIHNVIRSDAFPKHAVDAERLLSGSRVILCTLSMLSNSRISIFTRLVPVETAIFDEASQIEIGCYIPLLFNFRPSIKKLVFIGDDKQLPPYGHSDIDDLQSIFELPHLRRRAVLLDTQYRMPVPIGDFISKYVYDGKLKSMHRLNSHSCCTFVDVCTGKEESSGHSWVNLREVRTAVALARKFHKQGKSFRIITPYDAQRSKLENALKSEKLPWEDKCFNVDSFQGNEADHIIISLVRSAKIGFLKEIRRTNVMLTRCKKSMTICTSKDFLSAIAPTSLVGLMAESFGAEAWVDAREMYT